MKRESLRAIEADPALIEKKKYKKVKKVERLPGETKSECVDRAIPILIGEGMSQNQAVAAANDMCDLRKQFEED